ncbi:MAG: hypothetical protein EPO68_12435 [Planctomycetota bacterium]|nr:MAG: hypothetical protein EPO68_12435 [Planctomycetota bacterium]
MTSKKNRTKSKPSSEPVASAELKRCDLCGAESANLSYRDGNAACEKCAAATGEPPKPESPPKKRSRAKSSDSAAVEAATPKAKAAKPKRKGRAAETAPADASTESASPAADVVTLGTLCERYIAALDAGGEHSMGTMRGYTAELKVACREIGSDVALVDLTVSRVQRFFDCPAVTTTRDGEPKAAVGVAKTRRVLRLALLWAHEQGLVAQAPLPSAKD